MCLPTWWSRPRFTPTLLLLLCGISAASGIRVSAAPAPPATLNEYEIKAAAFYNVITFTNWPREAFLSPRAPLVVGILGSGPVAALIERVVAGESWRGRRIVIEHYSSLRTMKPCHVLYVAESERDRWANIRAQCEKRPVLAVSDGENFAASGGNVQLAIEQNKLRIFVNLAATRACGIELSSNLLHLSTIVGPTPDPIGTPRSGLQWVPLATVEFCVAMTH